MLLGASISAVIFGIISIFSWLNALHVLK
jgi:hypothetical protein